MPYTLVYSQAWAAGNSTFSQRQYYDRVGDGADASYPEINNAESVQVNAGAGPSGQNTLDNWTGGGDNDYAMEGVSLWLTNAPSVGTALSIIEGKAEISYKPNTQSLSDNQSGYMPLMQVFQYNDSQQIFGLNLYQNSPGASWNLELRSYNGTVIDDSYVLTPSAGTWYTFRVEFKRSDTGAGYLRVYLNNSLIYDYDPIYVAGYPSPSAGYPAYPMRTVWIGFNGLFGETTDFKIYELTAGTGTTVTVPAGSITVTGSVPVRGEKFIDVPAAAIWLVSDPVDTGAEVIPEIGESFGPLIWVEWTGSDAVKRVWAPVDLPDPSTYYGGFKIAKLLAPGPITRSLSDEAGEYQSQVFAAQVDDSDYTIRTLLGQSDTRRLIVNTLLVMRMISDPDRRALKTPRTVAIGMVRSYTLE